jgi:hypothetical protein
MTGTRFLAETKDDPPRTQSAAPGTHAGTCCAGRQWPPEQWAPPSCWPPAAVAAPPPLDSGRRRPARCARWSPTRRSSRSWAPRACSPLAAAGSRSGWPAPGRGRQPRGVARQGPDQPGARPLPGPLAETERLPADPRPLPPQPTQRLLPGQHRPAPARHLAGGRHRGGRQPARRRAGRHQDQPAGPRAGGQQGPIRPRPRWPPAPPDWPRSAPAPRSAPCTRSRWTRR